MTKTRSQELSDRADEERRRCRDWLLPFMQNKQPKFLTKDELRSVAMRELRVEALIRHGVDYGDRGYRASRLV
jgi:hypothetical protein